MGGHSSKFNQEVFETTTGGLYNATQTIDGSEPSAQGVDSKLNLEKNVRSFAVDKYFTRPVPKTKKGFDVYNSNDEEKPILRVLLEGNGVYNIYNFDKPVWDNQPADKRASKSAYGHLLYPTARIQFKDRHTAEIYRYERGEIGGINTMKPILRLEHVASGGEQSFQGFQSLRPNKDPYKSVSKEDTYTLVGYWNTQKILLAPEVDVAMHVVLTVIGNMRTAQLVRATANDAMAKVPSQETKTISNENKPKSFSLSRPKVEVAEC